jgi:hypothetical protein
MLYRNRLLVGCLVLAVISIACLPLLAAGQDKPKTDKPAAITVEKHPIKVDVALKGIFESASMVKSR